MPTRRASASAGQFSSSSIMASSSSRAHRANDSYHGVGAHSTGLHVGPLYGVAPGPSATPQQKIVHVLVNRLKNKLPCNSGLSLDTIEADGALQQAIESLVDLSRDSLDIIAWALTELLEKLAKQTDTNGLLTIEVLQSQLFILKVLSGALTSRWYHHEHPRSSSRASKPSGPASLYNLPIPGSPSPARSPNHTFSDQMSTPPPTWSEPPPLDDNCAKYILSVMVLFLRQTSPPDGGLNSSASLHLSASSSTSFYHIEAAESARAERSGDIFTDSPTMKSSFASLNKPSIRTQASWSSMGSNGSGRHKLASPLPPPLQGLAFQRTPAVLSKSSLQLNSLIAKFAGRIVYHLSASNWMVVFSRIRNRIHFLATTSEDKPDIVDLFLMTHSALDRTRLMQILQELSSLLLNMKRESQAAIAIPLRAAVWKWIDLFPEEFNDVVRSPRRMEGAPERVFDLFFERTDQENRKAVWPLLAVLMAISADRLRSTNDWNSSGYPKAAKGSHRKDNHFFEQLIKVASTPSGKHRDVAVVCALDLCRVAIRIKPEGDVNLISMANDIAHEEKALIWQYDGQRPFWDNNEEIDVSLFADVLVAAYRFLSLEEALTMITTCLEPEHSDAVKLCAVRAVVTLTEEASRLPWQPSTEPLHKAVAGRLRDIFKSCASRQSEVDEHGSIKRSAARPKSKRDGFEYLSDKEMLILAICTVWRTDARYSFVGAESVPEWAPVAIKMLEGPVDSSVKQASAWSVRFLLELIFQMRPDEPHFAQAVAWMRSAASAALIALGMNLLNARFDTKSQRIWIDLMHDLLSHYTRYTDVEDFKGFQLDVNRVSGFALAEIACLVSLSSVDNRVSGLAAQCLRLIADGERQPDAPVNEGMSDDERVKRHRIYDQLGDPKVPILGRVGHQKRIRKLVRSMASSMPCYIAVWQECYWRWLALTELAVQPSIDLVDGAQNGFPPIADMSLTAEERIYQWQNLTLFLASFGGACAIESHDPSALTSIIPAKYLPDNLRVLRDPEELAGSFVTKLIDLLMADTLKVREVARDALGLELSSRLNVRLYKHLDEVITDVTQGGSSQWSEHFALFLDQFIAVLKLLTEAPDNPKEERMFSINYNATLLSLAEFLARFQDPASHRLRLKLCNLIDAVYNNLDASGMRRDSSSSQKLLDNVIEWIQDPNAHADPEAVRQQHEVNMATLRTSVKIMDRLQLGLVDGAMSDNTGAVASRQFMRYTDLLLKALHFSRSESGTDDSVSDISSHSQRLRVSQRENELRELVITGYTRMVASNTESSIKPCLALAYHEDTWKRTLFAHVFARVLSQGTKFDASDVTTANSRKSRLCELVKKHWVLAVAICETCPSSDIEVIIPVLFNLFVTRASLMNLLKSMIEREIGHTENEAELFRSNSSCARLLSAFARIHGYNYLRSLIVPLIKSMTSGPPSGGYELDPAKAGDQDVRQNRKNVELVATSFLSIITASIPALPSMFREICAHIAKSVQAVWPEAKFAALGAFIFLRFISPAIVSPDIVDVEIPKDDGGVIRRGLMVIAKIIQNLANNIFFGKEAHMEVLNDFLRNNIVNVTRYLSEVNKYSAAATDDDPNEWLGTSYDDTDTLVLHRFFEKHADKVGKELLSYSKPAGEEDPTAIDGKLAWDELCAALVDLGQPMEVPRLSSLSTSDHREYLDLMSRFNHRSTESVRDLFVEMPLPRDQAAIFVLRLHAIDIESLDIELLMFHVLKILTSTVNGARMFELILDCTGFTVSSEVPIQWIKYCTELIPRDIRQRCMTAYVLNPNALTQRYLRRIYNLSAGVSFTFEIRAAASVSELLTYIPDARFDVLDPASKLESEACEEFRDITMRHAQQMSTPVILEVGLTHLRITSVKAQQISPTLACKSTEIISLAEISDIYHVSTGQEPPEFIIRRSRQGVTLYLASPSRDVIVKAIRSAKGNMRHIQSPGIDRLPRLYNISATLLQTGLYNVGSDEEDLRDASCILLSAVCSHLDYDGSAIVPSKAAFVPAHPATFVTQLSERLAAHAPNLTLDFFHEVANGMQKAQVSQKIYSLQYMGPWVKNLVHFSDPTSIHYDHSGAKLRDCVRLLVDMTFNNSEVDAMFYKYVWSEIGKLDSDLVGLVLDELIKTAANGAVESRRCDIVTNIISTLSSLNVRGKILSRLRKVLGKTTVKPTKSLPENVNWQEIASLTRLALAVSAPSKQAVLNQFFVPEVVHVVTILAGTGQTLVRTSVYGIVMNLLQSMCLAINEEAARPKLRSLLEECSQPETLNLFGLVRASPASEYAKFDPPSDIAFIQMNESLAQFMIRIVEASATSKGLLNMWRARWMSLVTSSAFQLSPPVQCRAFLVLGTLAVSDVDDDLLYQMLVAFEAALKDANETDSTFVVCLLRCIRKVVPGLMDTSRYLCQMFWLAVALLQSSHMAFYAEAAEMLQVSVEKALALGIFEERGVAGKLLEARTPLEEIGSQLDQLLGLSFDTNFSFSLASVIFKGLRHSGLRTSAEAALRSLLRATVRTSRVTNGVHGVPPALVPDALAFFLALIPVSTTSETYRTLLDDAGADAIWLRADDAERAAGNSVPHVPFDLLGINDPSIALFVTSFVAAMLTTAQGDDTETEIFYSILSDIACVYPETIQLAYESLQDKIKDAFAHSSNPAILSAASTIFRVAVQDGPRINGIRGSASSLTTVDETGSNGPGRNHIAALEEIGNMQGLPCSFQFLPSGRGYGTRMMNWIPELVHKIIELGISE